MSFTAHQNRTVHSPRPEHRPVVAPHEHQQKTRTVTTASIALCADSRKWVRQRHFASLRAIDFRRCGQLPTRPHRPTRVPKGSPRHSMYIGASGPGSFNRSYPKCRQPAPDRHLWHGTWDKILFIISCEMATPVWLVANAGNSRQNRFSTH